MRWAHWNDGSTQHVHIGGEWHDVHRDVRVRKESHNELTLALRGHLFGIDECARNGLSGFRVLSGILKSDASVLTDLTTKSAKELLVEPPATVELLLWEKRATLDARQTWDIASPRQHHQPRVCALQLVKDSLSHWTSAQHHPKKLDRCVSPTVTA